MKKVVALICFVFFTPLLLISFWAILPKTIEQREYPLFSKTWNGNFTRLKYLGMDITKSIGIFGKIPLEISFPTYQIYPDFVDIPDSITTVSLKKKVQGTERYWIGEFAGDFKNGNKRFHGIGKFHCHIHSPNITFVRIFEGTFYKPDGSIGSQIIDGFGSETVWSDNGIKLQEAFYKNGRWEYYKNFDHSGNVIFERARNQNDAY